MLPHCTPSGHILSPSFRDSLCPCLDNLNLLHPSSPVRPHKFSFAIAFLPTFSYATSVRTRLPTSASPDAQTLCFQTQAPVARPLEALPCFQGTRTPCPSRVATLSSYWRSSGSHSLGAGGPLTAIKCASTTAWRTKSSSSTRSVSPMTPRLSKR